MRRRLLSFGLLVGGATAVSGATAGAQASDSVRVTLLKPRFHLVSNSSGNLVVYADDSVAVVAGYQAPVLVRAARELLRTRRAPAVRYALALEGDSAVEFGDGGWGRLGASTLTHEDIRWRMQQHGDSSRRYGTPPVMGGLPNVGFSQVVQLFLPSEEAHIVRRSPGLTTSDVVVHFEQGGIIMLGNLIAADEYPDLAPKGGKLATYLTSIEFFANGFKPSQIEPIVPGRGRTLTQQDLKTYRAMLQTAQERIERLRVAERTEDEVVAAKPTADLDAVWGRGRVTPERFVRGMYRALAAKP